MQGSMASGINIYSQLLISTIRILDIKNSNSWYQQLFADIRNSNTDIKNTLLISGIHLLISRIRILGISKWIPDIKKSNSWYQEFEFLISRITITATLHYWYQQFNCWYQEFEFLISANRFPYYQEFVHIVDINNWNCWYQQLRINVNSACHISCTGANEISEVLWSSHKDDRSAWNFARTQRVTRRNIWIYRFLNISPILFPKNSRNHVPRQHDKFCQLTFSGVTRVGVTRGGNWGCHPYFFTDKNWRPFFCSSLSLLLISLGCQPLEDVTPYIFYLSDLVCPLCFVNSATTFFSFGCHSPWRCHLGRSAPPSAPYLSDATANFIQVGLSILFVNFQLGPKCFEAFGVPYKCVNILILRSILLGTGREQSTTRRLLTEILNIATL